MTTEQTLNKHEMLSALADGQLRGVAFAQAVECVQHDEEAQATWHRYHLIGDVMRSGELAHCVGDSAFLASLQNRLKQEPGYARPVAADVTGVALAPAQASADRTAALPVLAAAAPVAANAPNFRWKMVAGFASMAAVAAIGWNLVGAPGATLASSPQIALVSAQTPANASPVLPVGSAAPSMATQANAVVSPATQPTQGVAVANAEPQVMLRDRRLDELMAAHNQFGGTSALQMPAGFLRNATFEAPAR